MPYRRSNYDFVIDSSFTPFTMQEMLVPFTAYKEAYEQDQAAYEDLTTKADVFKDLSQSLPEGSEARRIYEGYANDLKAQADNLTQNGLTMSGRSALRNLKRRYSGEIGMLDRANEALKKERELRRQMSAKDPSMLYAVNPEELNIDQFLGGKTPSLYGVSGTELYTKAAAASQAASKRQFSVNGDSKTLGGYYYDYVQRMGYNPQTIAQFRRDMSSIPELQQAADDILMANGVTDNLSGRALEQARQQVINGMIDGAVYSEQHNPQRNLGVMTAAEQASDARAREGQAIQRESMNRQAAAQGLTWDGKNFTYDVNKDPEVQKQIAILQKKKELGIGNNGTESTVPGVPNFPQVNPKDFKKILINNGTTSNGTILSGEGEDTEIKKVDMTATARYVPFYGDAWNNDAKNGFDVLDWETSSFSEGDAEPYKFSQLKSDEAKQQIRDHVQEMIPDVLEGLTPKQVDEVIGYMDFVRDYDRFSDSHFRLSVPGTNEEGKIVDKNKFNKFLSNVNRMRIKTLKEGLAVQQQAPAGISNQPTITNQVPAK